MTTNLMHASREWASRPSDERFSTLAEMHAATKRWAEETVATGVDITTLDIEQDDDDIRLVGKRGAKAEFTHWSFAQFCGRLGAPASYLRTLPTHLVVSNLKHGMLRVPKEQHDIQLLMRRNGSLKATAITSPRYRRIWNHQIVERLFSLQEKGWRTPPARPCGDKVPGARKATKHDLLATAANGWGIKEGDLIAPAGLYASDRDMFAFLINEQNRINDGSPAGMGRGIFVENSETGGGAFKLTSFLYRFVCGNHIVWGAKDVAEVSIRHVGSADDRAFEALQVEMKKYLDSASSPVEAQIRKAQRLVLGEKREDVIDLLFDRHRILSKKALGSAYEMAENNDVDGDPRTAWGIAQGITRYSQTLPYADERTFADRAAAKVLALAN